MLVALGVSGGIAAYKACEIVRGLDKAGASVQVVMTANATRFITPLTLETLSRRRVLLDPFDLAAAETVQHIDLARQVDALARPGDEIDDAACDADGVATRRRSAPRRRPRRPRRRRSGRGGRAGPWTR